MPSLLGPYYSFQSFYLGAFLGSVSPGHQSSLLSCPLGYHITVAIDRRHRALSVGEPKAPTEVTLRLPCLLSRAVGFNTSTSASSASPVFCSRLCVSPTALCGRCQVFPFCVPTVPSWGPPLLIPIGCGVSLLSVLCPLGLC